MRIILDIADTYGWYVRVNQGVDISEIIRRTFARGSGEEFPLRTRACTVLPHPVSSVDSALRS
ncbi:MAG TPA: hypothetical protein VH008_34375, partial [Pseudonocardia sp.]|nr:hypothetical protein [Pseudonocardia sp.]